MASISRNAPCPCGSGKKYKNCCLGKKVEVKSAGFIAPVLICLAGVGMGIYAGLEWGPGRGISVGAGVIILVGLFWLFKDPPPPDPSAGDPGAINFGG